MLGGMDWGLRLAAAPHASPVSAQGMLVAILYCFVNKEVSGRAGSGRGAEGPC